MSSKPDILRARALVLRSLGHAVLAVLLALSIRYVGPYKTALLVVIGKEVFVDPHPAPWQSQYWLKSLLDIAVWGAALGITYLFVR